MKALFCVGHGVLNMLSLVCEERSKSTCVISCVIIRDQPGWKNRKRPLLLIFLSEILIPACASSSPAFHKMYSTYKLNKQGDNTQL